MPPTRSGSADYYEGDGDNIVALVDNVRDDNYFDTDNAITVHVHRGLLLLGIQRALDRNVMTIDAFDWLHRTGDNPPNEPVPGDHAERARRARSFTREPSPTSTSTCSSTTKTPTRSNWVNEGLSDYAQTLTGYVDPRPITDIGFDSHVQCFLGCLGRPDRR